MTELLASLQRLVSESVRLGSPITANEDLAARLEGTIVPGPRGMTSAQRLEVYREQFWSRHVSNLREDYPTLAWAVGGYEAFRALAIDFLAAHPPRTWNLQMLGARMPDHVSSQAPWRDDALAFDAARLDWAFVRAFDAPDVAVLDAAGLAAAPEEALVGARIRLHPSLHALALGHPLVDVREVVKRGEGRARPTPAATFVVVWRDAECFLRAEAIEPLAFELLTSLQRGELLGAACEALARSPASGSPSDLGALVLSWFQRWTAAGWISAVALGEPTGPSSCGEGGS